MVVAAIGAASTNPQNPNNTSSPGDQIPPKRPPVLPSGKDNETRRPKSKQVPSRYMSPTTTSSSSSQRSPSPLLSRSTNTNSTPAASKPSSIGTASRLKRSQSVDRKRPSTPRPMTPVAAHLKQGNAREISSATKMLITSTRSLSVSFQGESFSLPNSKTKAPNVSNAGKATPERRRQSPVRGKVDGGENSKLLDQNRWPARIRQDSRNLLSRSIDCTGDEKKLRSGIMVCASSQSVIEGCRHPSFVGRLGMDLGNVELSNRAHQIQDASSANESSVPCVLTASDTDSVSSGKQNCGPRGIAVSAKFWQETNSRLRRMQNPGPSLSTNTVSRTTTPTTFSQSRRFTNDSPLSSPRTFTSLVRGAARPASPSKLWTSSSSSLRGNPSPSQMRNSVNGSISSNSSSMPSILSYSVDNRRGKVGENRIIDAHILRLLYNRYLQWRFENARADATLKVQKLNSEKSLWNGWVVISELRHSVKLKRIKLLLLSEKLKLTAILKGQMSYLDKWALLDRDHSNSLLGATEALKASTLRLPVVGKAIADIQNLKDAVNSAVDVMHSLAATICYLSSMMEEMNSLVTELANVTAKERMSLDQCTELLSGLAAMQVKNSSLRTHILQLSQPSSRF